MLQRLADGRLRISELAEPLSDSMSLNAVSKHIKVLETADLIHRERHGREHFISLNPEPMREVAQLVRFFSRFWMERLDQLDRLLKSEKPGTDDVPGD